MEIAAASVSIKKVRCSNHSLLLKTGRLCPPCVPSPTHQLGNPTCDSVWSSWHFAIWWTPAGPLTCCRRTPPPPASTWKRGEEWAHTQNMADAQTMFWGKWWKSNGMLEVWQHFYIFLPKENYEEKNAFFCVFFFGGELQLGRENPYLANKGSVYEQNQTEKSAKRKTAWMLRINSGWGWGVWHPGSVPADDIQHHDEIVIFEIRHVRSQNVGLHFQLDVLQREGKRSCCHLVPVVEGEPRPLSGLDCDSDLPDPCQAVLQLLLHVAAVHHQIVWLSSSCVICMIAK